MKLTICREIRRVQNGWIVELRWPYGGEPGGYGEVICESWDDVLACLTRAADVEDARHVAAPPPREPEGG